MPCEHPHHCAERAARHRAYLERVRPLMEDDHRLFLEDYASGWGIIRLTHHAARVRQLERAIGDGDIHEVITCGVPVDYSRWNGTTKMRLMAEVRHSRHVMVVVSYETRTLEEEWIWRVVTTYDPGLFPWRYTPDRMHQICFCPLPSEQEV